MKRRMLLILLDVGVLLLVGGGIAGMALRHQEPESTDQFAAAVDLQPLESLAIQTGGRIKAFDSFARELMHSISGRRSIEGHSDLFSYLDLMFNPDQYRDVDTVYVKNKNVRHQILIALGDSVDRTWAEHFMEDGLISQTRLKNPQVQALLEELKKDIIRTSKEVERLEVAMRLSDPQGLKQRMRIVPPLDGNVHQRWHTLSDLVGTDLPPIHAHAGINTGREIPGLDDARRATLTEDWKNFAAAWKEGDAAQASAALQSFAAGIRGIAPPGYPTTSQMALENWYFRNHGMTWVWLVYLGAVVFLLMAVVYRWRWARLTGMAVFGLAFLLHTASLLIRWKVADRWPNSNMFEAIHTAAWFGVVAALVLEWLTRRTAMKNLFALAASVCAMAALMAGRYTDQITPEISNFMPILNDIWLYIHTNMIIWSYALIGMASITALLYLRYRLRGGSRGVARSGGAGSLLAARRPGGSFLRDDKAPNLGQVFDGATMIMMELAFVMLWAGLVMGAIWADHSWGRPWGWDPKEVFALNTFIIFVLLVHVRIKVRDKGLWTALLAVFGCGVMLFNWIVINFRISGLHSYA